MRFVLLLLMLPQLVLAAPALDDPWQLMEKAALAARKLNYQGVFVYQTGNSITSVQITHTNVGAAGEFARVVVLDGAPKEVLRRGNEVIIYQPKNQQVLIEKRRIHSSFPTLLPKISDALKTNYQLTVGDAERVVGREATVLTLTPHDKMRYTNKFWVDIDSGLLLKVALLNEKNEIIEQIGFTLLKLIGNSNMDWFRPSEEQNKPYYFKPEEVVTPSVQSDGWNIGVLPQGFRKVEQVLRQVPGKSMPVTHFVFCDGLASISLFIEPLEKGAPFKQGGMSQGATNLYATTIADHQIVVLGEVPQSTVMQIANSVNYKPQ